MTDGIWVSPTQYISFAEQSESTRRALTSELYTASIAGGFDPAGWLGTLPDPDPVLRKTGDGVSVLRALTADTKVISSIQNRKLGTLKKRDYVLEPGVAEGTDPDATAANVCKRLETDLARVDLYNVFSQVLDAPYYGYAVVEVLWEPAGGWMQVADLKPRMVEWFSFSEKHEPVFIGGGSDPQPIPFGKAVFARHFPEAANPFGLRLLSRCLWPVAIKKGGIRFWTMLCERFGLPWVIGRAPAGGGDKANREEIATALAGMVQDAVAVVSAGTEVDIHGLKGSTDLHPKLIEYNDKAIAMVLMGQTLTADIGEGGSRAAAQVHGGVLDDYREADETLITTFMEELSWIYTQVNAAGALSPVFRYREPTDYQAQADLDTKLNGVGVRFKKVHFERRYNLTEDEFDLDGGEPGGDAENGEKTELAAPGAGFGPNQQAIEGLIGALVEAGGNALAGNEKKILDAVLSAGSFEDAMDNLLALYPDLSTDRLQDLMERGLLNADLFGRWAVGDEGGQS